MRWLSGVVWVACATSIASAQGAWLDKPLPKPAWQWEFKAGKVGPAGVGKTLAAATKSAVIVVPHRRPEFQVLAKGLDGRGMTPRALLDALCKQAKLRWRAEGRLVLVWGKQRDDDPLRGAASAKAVDGRPLRRWRVALFTDPKLAKSAAAALGKAGAPGWRVLITAIESWQGDASSPFRLAAQRELGRAGRPAAKLVIERELLGLSERWRSSALIHAYLRAYPTHCAELCARLGRGSVRERLLCVKLLGQAQVIPPGLGEAAADFVFKGSLDARQRERLVVDLCRPLWSEEAAGDALREGLIFTERLLKHPAPEIRNQADTRCAWDRLLAAKDPKLRAEAQRVQALAKELRGQNKQSARKGPPPRRAGPLKRSTPDTSGALDALKQQQEVDDLVAKLGAKDRPARLAAAKRLREIGKPALAGLRKAARDRDPTVRKWAAYVIKGIEKDKAR